ncbi:MAG: diiron oxygenase, partial [Streptosporangiaceae bacterium]
ISREQRYDVYELFDWPDSLPRDKYWMSPELTTCFGTGLWEELDESARVSLSQYEAVNFFSVSIHLIRELISEVADRIYTTRFPGLSEFFHDFIHEENEHMWFFAQFCRLYGGKIYPPRRAVGPAMGGPDMIRDLLVFGRIFIAEELCDVFNARMADDTRLPPIARQINSVHHKDESRHIAFGRQMMRTLCEETAARVPGQQMREAGEYLARYISVCLLSLYNPTVYRDAGLPDARLVRRRVLADPARREEHRRIMQRTVAFLAKTGLLEPAMVEW